jgi:hypothetical protein
MVSSYHSFLLRLWISGNNSDANWYLSLENSGTGEKQIFAGLDDLHKYLKTLTGAPSASDINAEGEYP